MTIRRSYCNRTDSELASRVARTVSALGAAAIALSVVATVPSAAAEEQLPWGQAERSRVIQPGMRSYGDDNGDARTARPEAYPPREVAAQRDYGSGYPSSQPYDERDEPPPSRDYRPASPVYPSPDRSYDRGPDRPLDRPYGDRSSGDRGTHRRYDDGRYDDRRYGDQGPGRPYEPAPHLDERETYRPAPYARGEQTETRTYSMGEINSAGHQFFGRITSGLASVIEHAFKKAGRPNGYILGEEGGGAFIAGLRYGEGTLHMKDGTRQKVYWQGPSIGYDFGAEGSKTMILVYDLDHPGLIYSTFGGVSGSAYLVGGVGVTFMKSDEVTLAPIRSGVGLRLGANLGYLKYTRAPTWNPF